MCQLANHALKQSTTGTPGQHDRRVAQSPGCRLHLPTISFFSSYLSNNMSRPRVRCLCELCWPQQRLVSHSLPRHHLANRALHPEAVCSKALRRIASGRRVRQLASLAAGVALEPRWSSDSGSDSGVSMSAADDDGDDTPSETSPAADSQVPHASSSEGGMRSARSSPAQEGALPPPFPAGPTGALSKNDSDLQIAAEVMDYESQSRHRQSEHASDSASTDSSGSSGAIGSIGGGVSSSSGCGSVSVDLAAIPEQACEGDMRAIDEALEMAEGSDAETSALGRAACWHDLVHLAGKLLLIFCPAAPLHDAKITVYICKLPVIR